MIESNTSYYMLRNHVALERMQAHMDKLAVGYECKADPWFEYDVDTNKRKVIGEDSNVKVNYRADGRRIRVTLKQNRVRTIREFI